MFLLKRWRPLVLRYVTISYGGKSKLGFLVKQPEEPWFQTEGNLPDKAGKDLGFDVIKIAVPDGRNPECH